MQIGDAIHRHSHARTTRIQVLANNGLQSVTVGCRAAAPVVHALSVATGMPRQAAAVACLRFAARRVAWSQEVEACVLVVPRTLQLKRTLCRGK